MACDDSSSEVGRVEIVSREVGMWLESRTSR